MFLLHSTQNSFLVFDGLLFLLKNRKSLSFFLGFGRDVFLFLHYYYFFFFFRKTWKNGIHANRKRRDNGSNHICIFAIIGPYFCMYNLQSFSFFFFYAVTSINVMVINWTFQRWTPRTFLFFFFHFISNALMYNYIQAPQSCAKCKTIFRF